MSKFRVILFLLILSGQIYLFSTIGSPYFLKINDDPLLHELFTVNIGIMELKNLGNIDKVDPIDRQSILEAIKNTLEKVPAIRLSKKGAVLKAAKVYISKKKKNNEKVTFLEKKIFYSDEFLDKSLISELFFLFRKDDEFKIHAKKWFENIENPFYVLNIGSPFPRKIKTESEICDETTVNSKGPLDFLIHGEIERIDEKYFITIYIYSGLLKKRLREISFITDRENITKKTTNKIKTIISSIFMVKYASLSVDTTGDEVRIFLDSDYIGRDEAYLDFLVPGKYVITLSKDNFEDKYVNIDLGPFESKKVKLEMDKEKELKIVDFYIEPLGTKIFINSIFQGRSPFKKALPKGTYVISMKNELYEDNRYVFTVKDMEEKESTVVFHLKTKNINNLFKLKKTLYYCAFWNFTFSLFTMVPLVVFAYDYYYKYGEFQLAHEEMTSTSDKYFYQTPTGVYMKNITNTLYGAAAFMVGYTAVSLGWLFFSLTDYLITHEKRDFIPVIEYFHSLEGREEVNIGMKIRF